MAQDPQYLKAFRIRKGRQKTIPIPVAVLADVLTQEAKNRGHRPVSDHLGSRLVEAVHEAAANAA